jgi:hypothetical protein
MTPRRLRLGPLLLLASLVAVQPGRAQEGHPLTGTWVGDWGPTPNPRRHLTLVMTWDGKNVLGTINPGPDAVSITSVIINFSDWSLRFEADGRDHSGSSIHVAAEGRLDDLGSPHRRMSGRWRQGTESGDFNLRRE